MSFYAFFYNFFFVFFRGIFRGVEGEFCGGWIGCCCVGKKVNSRGLLWGSMGNCVSVFAGDHFSFKYFKKRKTCVGGGMEWGLRKTIAVCVCSGQRTLCNIVIMQ